jgi:mRNA-degrading endonuclease RelE of RelBE toxin-antitoxin system
LARAIARLPEGDVRHLVGRDDEWRLPVGDWRVRYRLNFEQRTVEVLLVLPRGSAYQP